jgi:transcriptional regulator with XRE-family HTH domain
MLAGVYSLEALASRLRRLRLRHALTQEEFAEASGLSYKFYQQIEAGRKKQLWLQTLERLAAGFGVAAWQMIAPHDPAHTSIDSRGTDRTAKRVKAVAESAATYAGAGAKRGGRRRRRTR